MREDAIRRAREMQSRARIPREGPLPRPQAAPVREQAATHAPTHQEPERQEQQRQEPAQHASPPNAQPPAPLSPPVQEMTEAPANNLLESLFKDKERTIILALLILLSGEENSHELMFALMFLLI